MKLNTGLRDYAAYLAGVYPLFKAFLEMFAEEHNELLIYAIDDTNAIIYDGWMNELLTTKLFAFGTAFKNSKKAEFQKEMVNLVEKMWEYDGLCLTSGKGMRPSIDELFKIFKSIP